MKPKKQQLPKARVMFCHQGLANPYAGMRRDKNEFYPHPVAVIPAPTAKQAKAIAAFFNLSEEEQVEAAAKQVFSLFYADRPWSKWKDGVIADEYRKVASAVLRRVKG